MRNILCIISPSNHKLFGFHYIDSTIHQHRKPLVIFCGSTDWFMSDLVGNIKDRFSRDVSHLIWVSI